MSILELIALDESTPQLQAPTSSDTGLITGAFKVNGASTLVGAVSTGALTPSSIVGWTIGTNIQAFNARLTDVSGLSPTNSAIIVGDGNNFVLESGATALTSLGAATRGANSDITSITGLTTDLTVAQGGTGASTFTDGAVLLGSGTGAITALNVTAKGSLLVGDGTTDPVALAVGTNDHILTADSSVASGTKWAAVPAGARSLTGGNIFITESAAASSDIAGDGQIWVDDAVPNTLMFTNDAGTDYQVANTTDVTTEVNATKVIQGTKVASTSGTAINFTGVPAGAKRVTLSMQGVSTNGTSPHRILIGDSGGLETSGYLGAQALVSSGGYSSSTGNISDGMRISQTQAADTGNGTVVVNLIDASTNTWGMSVISGQTTNQLTLSASSKSLSAALDRITYTTVNGSDTFDAGLINIQYEI